jgi:predicted enzyme related to lactoylglutathione lyase
MHRSRLAGFIIDCQSGDLEVAARFWSEALGMPLHAQPTSAGAYRQLDNAPGGLHVEVQQVTHPSRVHLDIESDNIEAEVARLEALGAKHISAVKSWVVMEAPTGHRFCVVRPQSEDFPAAANRWE